MSEEARLPPIVNPGGQEPKRGSKKAAPGAPDREAAAPDRVFNNKEDAEIRIIVWQEYQKYKMAEEAARIPESPWSARLAVVGVIVASIAVGVLLDRAVLRATSPRVVLPPASTT